LNENIGRWEMTWFTFIYYILSVLILWGTTSISKCRKLLNNEIVDVEMLYDFLRRCRESVSPEDYCRLYIVLGISEFLIPSRKGTIFPMLFTIVDDLSSLGKYN